LQRFKDALTALEQAAQLEPNNLETRLNLGYAYAKQKRYREAIAEMQKAVRLNANDEQA
jgi:Flp pilus assembly protein TadD